MTEKQRDKMYTFTGSLITSIIVVFVAFALEANRNDDKDLIFKIDNKLDKTVFEKKCEENNIRMTNIETKQTEALQINTEILQEILKQNATMQTDIAWIKREIDRKNN